MTRSARREMWVGHIENYRASGSTAAKWCEETGTNIYTLKSWIRKFNKENLFHRADTQWITMRTNDAGPLQNISPLIIKIGCSSIEVRPGFDIPTFKSVVGILVEQC